MPDHDLHAKFMSKSMRALFDEAHRRYEQFGKPNGKRLEDMYVGWGLPNEYRYGVSMGYFKAHDREIARHGTWYKLTEDGVKLFADAFDKLLAAVAKNTQAQG